MFSSSAWIWDGVYDLPPNYFSSLPSKHSPFVNLILRCLKLHTLFHTSAPWPTLFLLPEIPSLSAVLSHVRLFATSWTVARQDPGSMGFPRQEHWSRFPFPSYKAAAAAAAAKSLQSCQAAVPNFFGTRDQLCGRQLFHRLV